ncbi:hypothetical protein ZWY2020_035845 [Hordeum vulgare]|nr:hypothetical protein ZWY2020_035845 [Hordeum vulgare]
MLSQPQPRPPPLRVTPGCSFAPLQPPPIRPRRPTLHHPSISLAFCLAAAAQAASPLLPWFFGVECGQAERPWVLRGQALVLPILVGCPHAAVRPRPLVVPPNLSAILDVPNSVTTTATPACSGGSFGAALHLSGHPSRCLASAICYGPWSGEMGDADMLSVHPHRPGDFLLRFRSMDDHARMATDSLHTRRFTLVFSPWGELVSVEPVMAQFHVRIEMRGIPDHAWNCSSALTLLAPFRLIKEIAPKTRSERDLSVFRLTAWTANLDVVPCSSELLLPPRHGLPPDANPNCC